jgi:hypothetical protein
MEPGKLSVDVYNAHSALQNITLLPIIHYELIQDDNS